MTRLNRLMCTHRGEHICTTSCSELAKLCLISFIAPDLLNMYEPLICINTKKTYSSKFSFKVHFSDFSRNLVLLA